MGLHTNRLLLRQWKDSDYEPFADLNADPSVMEFFPRTLTRQESRDTADAIRALIDQRGWGMWALELNTTGEFIGFTGLNVPKASLPCSPCVEIGWRLARRFWGFGYAPEAACEALEYAFARLGLAEVVSFTAKPNLRSQAVMRKIGMENTNRNFMHPDVDPSSPLCEHVLFVTGQVRWEAARAGQRPIRLGAGRAEECPPPNPVDPLRDTTIEERHDTRNDER